MNRHEEDFNMHLNICVLSWRILDIQRRRRSTRQGKILITFQFPPYSYLYTKFNFISVPVIVIVRSAYTLNQRVRRTYAQTKTGTATLLKLSFYFYFMSSCFFIFFVYAKSFHFHILKIINAYRDLPSLMNSSYTLFLFTSLFSATEFFSLIYIQ